MGGSELRRAWQGTRPLFSPLNPRIAETREKKKKRKSVVVSSGLKSAKSKVGFKEEELGGGHSLFLCRTKMNERKK